MNQCNFCVMDESDPEIKFSVDGCSNCIPARKIAVAITNADDPWQQTISKLKAERLAKRPILMGLSGGLDSSFLLYKLVESGIRPQLFHVDAGWNRPQAVKNVYALASHFDLELETKIVNWKVIRDIQRAFLKSGLTNQDVPQDHIFFSSLYREARKLGARCLISGWNFQTESILPKAWSDNPMDKRLLQSVIRRDGLKKVDFPSVGYSEHYLLNEILMKIKVLKPLSYVQFNKSEVIDTLKKIGWSEYGGKHEESYFTKYYQGFYLIKRFGIDKRKAHLSSLIVSGQMNRSDALFELSKPAIPAAELEFLRNYIALKLEISLEELSCFENLPSVSIKNYANSRRFIKYARPAYEIFRKLT